MRESFKLGRIAGIRVGLNLSVLAIMALLVAGLAFVRFPVLYPDRAPWAYLVAGVITSVVFFGSLLAHELAHALIARRNGLEVEGITLWLLGGVARLRGEPRSAGADFRIAVIGPVTSLALGVMFAVVTAGAAAVGASGLIIGVLSYLAGINILLALFNLIPAAPLDGGRVLRAFLWWRRGDRRSAIVTAARAGQLFGFALIGLGVVEVVFASSLGGLWLALIGWFVVTAALAEKRQAGLMTALADVTVGEVMSPNPVTVRPEETVLSFIERVVLTQRLSTYPLVDSTGELSGLVTLARIRDVPTETRGITRLGDIAHPLEEVPTARPGEKLTDLLSRMTENTAGRVVVVDGTGAVIGIVTPSDIRRALQVRDLDPFIAPGIPQV